MLSISPPCQFGFHLIVYSQWLFEFLHRFLHGERHLPIRKSLLWAVMRFVLALVDLGCWNSLLRILITWPQFGIDSPYLGPSWDQFTCLSGSHKCASWSSSSSSFIHVSLAALQPCLRLVAGSSSFSLVAFFLLVPLRTWLLRTLSNLLQLSQFCRTSVSPSPFISLLIVFLISCKIWRFWDSRFVLVGFKTSLDHGVSPTTCTDLWKSVSQIELAFFE